MKFRITVKDPDGIYNAMQEAVAESLEDTSGLSYSEKSLLCDDRMDSLKSKLSKWIEYDEYIIVEIDTEADTATVVEV